MSASKVDLLFLCSEHRVHERGLRRALRALLELGDKPCSIENLAEIVGYSPDQTKRFVRALAYQDEQTPPAVFRLDGRRGRRYRHSINWSRAYELGLVDYAA